VTVALRPRLFLDSNVLVGAFAAAWGPDKAVVSLCAARICRLVLADPVREEVERNLALVARRHAPQAESLFSEAFGEFLRLAQPEIVPFPSKTQVQASRHLIRHQADLPVLLSACNARPDWLLTNNTHHFTPLVASETGLRIATPAQFFRALATSLP
jgi:predicted nucleic acid-binding protein